MEQQLDTSDPVPGTTLPLRTSTPNPVTTYSAWQVCIVLKNKVLKNFTGPQG